MLQPMGHILTGKGIESVADLPALPELYTEPRWYAAYTAPRHEKKIAEQLRDRSIESFLPLYETMRRWKNGRHKVQLPLFPGYVFVHIPLREKLSVLKLPSVVRLVGFNGQPLPLSDDEVAAIQTCLNRGSKLAPHPFLAVGKRVRIIRGPLEGLEGIVVRKKSQCRFVISLELIQRSVAVDVEQDDLFPLNK